MTAQIPERLIANGRDFKLCSEPLSRYLESLETVPKMPSMSSRCWRGYVGTWEIRDGRLYLIGIEIGGRIWRADISDDERELMDAIAEPAENKASLETLFPGKFLPIFADWFSGVLRWGDGSLVNYVHAGYASTYEKEGFFEVINGVVINETGGFSKHFSHLGHL